MEYSLGLYEKAIPAGMDFPGMFEVTRSCGFDRLEISIDETDWRLARLDWDSARQRELGVLSRAMETPLLTMCLSGHRKYPLGSHDGKVREKSMEIMRKAIRFAVNTGISIIQLAGYDVYYEQGDEETQKYFEENLYRSAEYAARWGVTLAFETMETPFMDTIEKSMNYINSVGYPWLQVYPDIGNLKNAAVLYGLDVVDDLWKGAGHISAVHLKETRPGVYRDMVFGENGHTEYVRCIAAALQMGVRIFTGEFWYQTGQVYREMIMEANAFLRGRIEEAAKEVSDQQIVSRAPTF